MVAMTTATPLFLCTISCWKTYSAKTGTQRQLICNEIFFHGFQVCLPRKYTARCFRRQPCHAFGAFNIERGANLSKEEKGRPGFSYDIFTKVIRGFFFRRKQAAWRSGGQIFIKRRNHLSLVASALLTLLVFSWTTDLAASTTWALTEENLIFLEAWRLIDRAYIDKTFNGQSWFRYREDALRHESMSSRQETYAAIRRMLATLNDPFTRFLEPEKFQSLRSGTNGAVTGVGLEMGFATRSGALELVVVAPIVGGPAERAGIVPGDVILAINGLNVKGMTLYEAAQLLQGPEQSSVELTLLDKGPTHSRTIQMRREKVNLNPVTWHYCDLPKYGDNFKLGYIHLSSFNQNSIGSLKNAIEKLREIGAIGYVLDIRNNSGGLFPAAIEIAKMWLNTGVIVYISDSKGIRDIYESDGTRAIASTEPLIVLVNKGTASASEILAGALKDNRRAFILGEPTFGKGKIQSVFELSDGSGMVVTVAKYKTPANIDIDKVGITPDFPFSTPTPIDGENFCKSLGNTALESTFPPKLFFSKP